MSVKIVSVNPQCSDIEGDGIFCYCRKRAGKDIKSGKASRELSFKEKLTVDLGPPLKDGTFTSENRFSVYLNCGVVSVEAKECWDITVINSETPNRQYKTLTFDKTEDNPAKNQFQGVFRILPPKQNDFALPPIHCDPLSKRSTEKKFTLRLVFQPELPGTVYNKVFNIWIDEIPIQLKVRGFSQGPSVCLSQNILNFGGIFLGDEITLDMELHNHSQTTAQFQFDNDNMRSVFQVCPLAGTIKPMQIIKLKVKFNPTKANSFYKRVYCLVHHQDPQLLDLIGVSVQKPKIFDGPIAIGVDSSETELIPYPSDENNEYFEDVGFWGVKLEKNVVDFGFQDAVSKDNSESEPVTLSITSDLPYDVKMEWSIDTTNVFVINPGSQILPANQSVSFQVEFRPGFPESFYDGSLEFYIYPIDLNWSKEGPPWVCLYNKSQIGQPIKEAPNDETHHHHENADMLRTSHSMALKEDAHYHESDTNEYNGKIKSIAIVKTENDASGDAINSFATDLDGYADNKSATNFQNPERAESHAHFYHHQHIVQEKQSNGDIDTANPPVEGDLNSEIGFEMHVRLKRQNSLDPVLFTVDPVGDVTYVVRINEERNDNNVIRTDQQIDSINQNSLVNKSVLRKPGTENMYESGGRHDSTTGVDNGGIDVSTMMPSYITLNNITNCQKGAGDGSTTYGLSSLIALPLCGCIKVTGHTFTPAKFPGIPDISVPSKALMYSTLPFNPVCRSLLLRNNSDLPIYFNLTEIDGDGNYTLKPAQGLISGKCHQIILALLNPNQSHNKLYVANCNFKVNLQDNCQVGLLGFAGVPTLGVNVLYESSAKGQEIVCLPTIPGCISQTFIELENTSGFHYRFWLEPADWTGDIWKCITPEPANGYIAPYEKVPIVWTFTPTDELTYYVYWRFCFDVIQSRSDSKTSHTDYEFIIPLTGAGRHGSLVANPGFIDFDLVPIFETDTKYFSITNHGAAAFTVDLIVCHEQWLRDFSHELVTISPTTVTLEPHESVVISVTVRPSRANIQNFYIIYEWHSNSPNMNNNSKEPKLSDFNTRHLVDITFMGDHAIFKATDIMQISRNPIWDSQQCFEMFSIERLNQLMIPYNHSVEEGNFPNVPSVTFQFPPAPLDSEPSVFQLLLSNTSDLKGYWDILTTPPKNWRKLVGAKEPASNMQMNNGRVKDSPDVLAKLWAAKIKIIHGKNNSCELQKHATKQQFLNCLESTGNNKSSTTHSRRSSDEYFDIPQTSGCINNNDSQVLTFKYNFKKLGTHAITVLLRVYPGIFIWIDLSGRTLDFDKPYLQPMYQHNMNLHPVSAADLDPPVQMFWLYNGGNVPAGFTVDMEPFEDLKEKNFGHAVIECLTTAGTVRPKSWYGIKLRFSPLEYADYAVLLKLFPDYFENPVEVIVTGSTALNPLVCLRPKASSAEIRSFVMYDHAVPISLCPPHIAISHFISTGHKVKSCVFLTNMHTENSVLFRWPEVSIEGGGSITFQPDSGRIPPRGEISCLVIIQAGKVAATFSTTIRCLFEDENQKIIYDFVVSQWEKQEEKATLLDSKYSQGKSPKKTPKPEPPKPFSRLLAISVYIGSVFGLYDSITPKERSRMTCTDPIVLTGSLSLPPSSNKHKGLILSNFEREISEGVVSELIWDIVQGSGFESFVRLLTKRNAPVYEEYKECESGRNQKTADRDEHLILQRQPLEDVLEATVFNLIQEMSSKYIEPETREKWFELPQIQPQAFVEINKYKNLL